MNPTLDQLLLQLENLAGYLVDVSLADFLEGRPATVHLQAVAHTLRGVRRQVERGIFLLGDGQ